MSELKNAIDRILSDRAEMRKVVDGEKSKIDTLIGLLHTLKDRINETGDPDVMQQAQAIDNSLAKLSDAQRQAQIISERFNRNTVNIGVAGNTHAGKTTTLRSISGANKDLLPDAPEEHNQKSTTAVRSEIYNCKKGDERVEIKFKTESEFVKFINDYMSALPGSPSIVSKESFKNFDFQSVSCQNNIQEYSRERLEDIQKSYSDYSGFIGNPETVVLRQERFKEVIQYVAYLYDGQKQYYPAVSEVKIYCPFGNIEDDVQLGLIDLPGFGENKNVDKIMLHGLQTKVDHAIQIFRTVDGGTGIQQKDSENYDKVREAVSEVSSFGDYLSFFINIAKTDNVDNIIRQMEEKIPSQFNKKYTHPLYKAPGNNRDEVKEPFLQIVQRLVKTLPGMDREAYNAYRKNLSFDGIRETIAAISKNIKQKGNIDDNECMLTEKSRGIRNQLSNMLDDFLRELDSTNAEFSGKAQEIHDKMAKEAERTWKDCEQRMLTNRSQAPYFDELNRLKTLLIYNYSEEMNKSYIVDLDGIKNRLVEIFASCTGNMFIEPSLAGIIDTLKECSGVSEIQKAFEWLNDVTLDFRHTIYSYLKTEKVFDKLNGLLNLPTDNKNTSNKTPEPKQQSNNLKSNVNKLFTETNDKILEIIKKNDHTKESFLGIVELFTEILVRFNGESISDDTYKTFYKYFRDRIESKEDSVDWKSMLDIATQSERLVNDLNRQ